MEEIKYRTIAMPTALTEWSNLVLPYVLGIMRSHQAELVLLHVFTPQTPELVDYVDWTPLVTQNTVIQELREDARKQLEDYCSLLRQDGHNVRGELLEGSGIAQPIIDYVNRGDIDLMVMSTHGRTGLTRKLFGSLAQRLLLDVHIPILLYNPR